MNKEIFSTEEIARDILELYNIQVLNNEDNLLDIGLDSFDLFSLVNYELIKYNVKIICPFYINEIWSVAQLYKYIKKLL
ncbi:MAG: hypothetical protein HDQ97_17285 [Lachnospiraceae bacterium]|nr:hypothetical protein [Lachnospiraceae bacterium]